MEKQKEVCDRHSQFREFKEDIVFARNYRTGPKQIEATVCKWLGPVSYIVKLKNGVELRRHIDQLHKRTSRVYKTDKSDILLHDFLELHLRELMWIASSASPQILGPRTSRICKSDIFNLKVGRMYCTLAEILGGQGGLRPPLFKLGGHGPPTLQRRQLYMWVGYSQYSVNKVALSELSDSCKFSFYTKIIYKLYTHACNS